jgi:hypothetical protein
LASLRVVYYQDGIYMWQGGESTALGEEGNAYAFAFSDDGQFLAYIREGDLAIHDFAIERETLYPTSRYIGRAGEFHWIPGTHDLLLCAFQSRLLNMESTIEWPTGLFRINAETEYWTLVLPADRAAMDFEISGDGRRLFLNPRNHMVALANIDGSQYRSCPIDAVFFSLAGYAWRDSARDLFFYGRGEPYETGSSILFRVASDGSDADPVREFPGRYYYFHISPDASYLVAYDINASIREGFSLYERNSEQPVFHYQESIRAFLGWSPDSRHFAFQTREGAVYIVKVGFEPTVLPDDRNPKCLQCFRWADEWFFFYRIDGKGLYLASVDSMNQPITILDPSYQIVRWDFTFVGKSGQK